MNFIFSLVAVVWVVEHIWLMLGILAALILLIFFLRRAKKKRAALKKQAIQQTNDEDQEKQSQCPDPVKPSVPSKAQRTPDEIDGKQLVYRYTDVRFSPFDPAVALKLSGRDISFSGNNNKIGIYSDGALIGVMAEGKLCGMVSDWLENGDPIFAVLTHTASSGDAFFDLFFYRSEMERLLSRQDAKKYKLTGNRSEAFQDGLSLCSVGEECSVDYDYEKEKYAVSTSYADLGFLPASAAKIVEDAGAQNTRVFIADLDEDDNGKTIVSVYVFSE